MDEMTPTGRSGGGVGPSPLDDAPAASDDVTVVEHQDGDGPLPRELLYFGTVAGAGWPRPDSQRPALHGLDLVAVPGVIERLCGSSAGMGDESRQVSAGLLEGACVENHG